MSITRVRPWMGAWVRGWMSITRATGARTRFTVQWPWARIFLGKGKSAAARNAGQYTQ